MITRSNIISNASNYLPGRLQSWRPSTDTHVFSSANSAHTFHSAYTTGQYYDVFPYVFGGFDSRTNFETRISNNMCPGGWDRRNPLPNGIAGRTTLYWKRNPPNGLGYGYRVVQSLCGIDCSGLVLRSWGFTNRIINRVEYSTRELPGLCLEISRRDLKKGDILNRAGSHVRIFNATSGSNIKIIEARGGSQSRRYEVGDEEGRVVQRDIAWDERYIPYSPFPQLIEFEPTPRTYHIDELPISMIRAKFNGSGELTIHDFSLDGQPFTYREYGTSPKEIKHISDYNLWPGGNGFGIAGEHVFRIKVSNQIVDQIFIDTFEFKFFIIASGTGRVEAAPPLTGKGNVLKDKPMRRNFGGHVQN